MDRQKNIKLSDIEPNKGQIEGLPQNPRFIKDNRFKQLVKSIEDAPEMLDYRTLLVFPHEKKYVIIAGNMRYRACKELGYKELPCYVLPEETPAEKLREYAIKDNIGFGADDWDILMNEWDTEELKDWGMEMPDDWQGEEEGNETSGEITKQKLTDEFLVPPLSILDTTQGYWLERKKAWESIGMKSEKGRDDKMMKSLSVLGRKASGVETSEESIFDPVLCDTLYTWFCKEGGQILDPFAVGSVRGIVANYKNIKYTGFDIRQEQIEANNEQKEICKIDNVLPTWICADSNTMEKYLAKDFEADFVFSCPPYADLEVYSDIDGDLSNMEYNDFKQVYSSIIQKSCDRLKDNRFACFVVGEVRNRKGLYYNFVGDTIQAFESAGLKYYNEIILKNSIGTKRMTCGIGMRKTRKVGKIHQNVLVFVKGDPKKAVEYLGDINIYDMEMLE